ncbi:SAM-dependent methyltransferase [Enterococcus sp. LJL120]
MNFQVEAIGKIINRPDEMALHIDQKYLSGLQGLAGFSHLAVIWWFSDFDTEAARATLEVPQPYRNAPEVMGIFATRSPVRPNPLALTMVEVLDIDYEKGMIYIPYIDANDDSPLLDIKPYTPSADRIEEPKVPAWCQHWPQSYETSGDFDWEAEFLF